MSKKIKITWGDKSIIVSTKNGERIFEKFMKQLLGANWNFDKN